MDHYETLHAKIPIFLVYIIAKMHSCLETVLKEEARYEELLQEFVALADIISAIAIIISLVFVGYQIKDNTKATQASTFHEIAVLDIQILLSLGSSKESAKIITHFEITLMFYLIMI